MPKTSQTPYMDMYDQLLEAAKANDTVIYFTISSEASGQNHTASLVAEQIKEEVEEQKTINRSLIPQLFKKFDELSLAYVDRIQQETGLVILKCPRNMAPRLKVQKSFLPSIQASNPV